MIPQMVTRWRPVKEEDEQGNERIVRWDDATIEADWIGQIAARELTGDRETFTAQARGILPAETDIEGDDEIEALGHRWRIIGMLRIPMASDPDIESHVAVDLERG